MRRDFPWRMAWIAGLALLLATGTALGDDQLLVDLIPVGTRARNDAPIPIEAKFKWDSTRVLDGRLEMEFYDGGRILGHYRSDELELTSGEQSFRMLLPPSQAPYSDSQVDVRMKFVSSGGTIELTPSVLFVPAEGERSLVVGWCDSTFSAGQHSRETWQALALEQFAPAVDPAYAKKLMTSMTRLAPEDLPAEPLAYTSFDIMALTAEGFKQAGARQLDALARWVKGGGSVCVFVGGGLQNYHTAFLNQLAESPADGPAFWADDAGNLLPARNGLLCLHSGLGRSVIITGTNAVQFGANDPDGRKAAEFLWKLRGSQAHAVARQGHWDVPQNSLPAYRWGPRWQQNGQRFQLSQPSPSLPQSQLAYAGSSLPPTYGVEKTGLAGDLMTRLMPQTVRLIPFSGLLGMLGLFVLMIGPVDYYTLGMLRRRKYTWILFPATSLVFTIATVVMADYYLGIRDQRRSLTVVDIGKDGTALRWNRYELVFAARNKQAVTELKDALWNPVDIQAPQDGMPPNYPGNNPYQPQYNPYNPGSSDDEGPAALPWYEGVLPAHFQTSESLRQWRPELNRTFSFESPPVPVPPNWKAAESAWPDLENIRAKLSEKGAFHGDLYAVSGQKFPHADTDAEAILSDEMLRELCTANPDGLLSVVSQVSPTGGGNFDDVHVLDTDSGDSALMAVTQTGDDIVVYRRIFYGN